MITDESKTAEVYSKAALFINACNMEVTAERMQKVLQVLGFPFRAKLAEMFEISPHMFNEMMTCVSVAPAAVAAQPTGAQEETTQDASEKEAKKEEPEEDGEIDFGEMFF
eukprot:jgi/Antlo1/1924/571